MNSGQFSPIKQNYDRRMYLLETENVSVREELKNLLFKLTNMEEIQLKYELLLGQSENQNQQLKINQLTLQKKTQEQLRIIVEEKNQQHAQKTKQLSFQHTEEILQLRQKHKQEKQQQDLRYNQLKALYETLSLKSSEMEVFSFKLKKYEKQISELQEQLQTQKQMHQQAKEQQLPEQKLSLTKKMKQKSDAQIQNYEQRIRQLTKRLNHLQLQNDLLLQKNKNLSISEETSNVDKLKEILSNRKSIQKEELSKMQEALDRANNQLKKVIEQKYNSEQRLIQREAELKRYIHEIENSFMEQQKNHTKQIFTLQQKNNAIKQEEIDQLKNHIESLKNQFDNQKKVWDNLSNDHFEEITQLREEQQKNKNQFQQQKAKWKSKIKQLTSRLEEYQGKRMEGQTQQLISSLRDLDEREERQAKYQNGLVFLERQLRKANIMIDQKNQQIAKMLKQISDLRQHSESEVRTWRDKYRADKKQFLDRIFSLENQARDLGDKLRFKERQLQKNQKQTSFQKIQLQKKIDSLKDLNEELKRDYDRVVIANKALQMEYRGQRDRGVTSKGDVTVQKRMKWLELEKQKNELAIIYREKQEQLKIIYEQQIDQLRAQRDFLKQKTTLLEDDQKRLMIENIQLAKRVQNKENLNGKSSKKKSGQMQKKIASLDLQIALTKNLFENLQKAKTRLKSRDLNEIQKQVSVDSREIEENEESFQ